MVHANAMTPAQAKAVRKRAAGELSTPAKAGSAANTTAPVAGEIVFVGSKHVSATKKQAIAKGGKKK